MLFSLFGEVYKCITKLPVITAFSSYIASASSVHMYETLSKPHSKLCPHPWIKRVISILEGYCLKFLSGTFLFIRKHSVGEVKPACHPSLRDCLSTVSHKINPSKMAWAPGSDWKYFAYKGIPFFTGEAVSDTQGTKTHGGYCEISNAVSSVWFEMLGR